MASADVFLSSPPRQHTIDSASTSSSSPSLPSLDEIFLKKKNGRPPFRAGSQTTHILATARASFTTAADVLRTAPEIDIDTETITSSPSYKRKTTSKGRTRDTPTPDRQFNDQVSKESAIVVGSLSPQDKPWQKFKTKSVTAPDGNQSLSPTKPDALRATKSAIKTGETVSRHFPPKADKTQFNDDIEGRRTDGKASAKDRVGGGPANSELELAVARRTDWTPPRAGQTIVLDSDSDTRELLSSVDREAASKDVFRTLYNQYGRQELDTRAELCPQPEKAGFLRKRKRIELISVGQEDIREQPSEESTSNTSEHKKRGAPKIPAPKKKARTITELATAPFVIPAVPDLAQEGPATEESMLNYFDSDGAVKALVEHQSAVMSQRKPTAKEKKQPAKTKRKSKTGTQANPILLSPNSALRQSSNQDFVFGTSSQLMREDSPTLLKDLEAAIRASGNLVSDPFDEVVGQRLWRAGARDEDGELIGADTRDLRDMPAINREPSSIATAGRQSFIDIEDLLDSPNPASLAYNKPPESGQADSHSFQPQSTQQDSSTILPELECTTAPVSHTERRPNYELFTDIQLSKQITSYGFKPVKKRTAMIALLDQCWASKHEAPLAGPTQSLSTSAHQPAPVRKKASDIPDVAAPKPRGRGRPKKDNDKPTQVAEESTLTIPSPKRARGRPKKDSKDIPVAEEPVPPNESPKRARGRRKKDSDETTPVPQVPAPTNKSPKRARARNKKTETASTSTAVPSPKKARSRRKSSNASIEIPDSEYESPSLASSSETVFSSPPPLDLMMLDEDDMSLAISPTDQQAALFKHITKAVTSTPRSQDPSNPSWHEKMLLYDPIILEDFASWLNRGQLTRVGFDGEVSPLDVKKWCESKSVICLWRETHKGKERRRY